VHRARSSVLMLLLVAPGAAPLIAQAPGAPEAMVVGRVADAETGEPVVGALVVVEGHELGALTDSQGSYRLARVPAGPQVLRAERIGYAPVRAPVTVPTRGTLRQDFSLSRSALRIEGIVVTADPMGRARGELGTASVVGREAIANQVATSLAGVLELVPGMPMSAPGLEGVQQVSLRAAPTTVTETGELAAFGTLIILDGVPLSNNANLQSPPAGIQFATAARGGIDLRRIPASTIERVEVIRGVPSARFGDLTQGAIVVETRTAAIDPELAVRFDPRMANTAVVAGRALGAAHTGAVSFDAARHRPNAGLRDDEAYRLSLQLMHRGTWGGAAGEEGTPRLVLDTRVDAFRVLDDRPVIPDDVTAFATSIRDQGFRLSERARLRLGEDARLQLTASLDMTRQRSFWQTMRTSAATPFTDRLTEGRSTGHFIAGPYLARIEVDGEPWMGYGRLEYETSLRWLGASHALRTGVEARREWNSGPGYRFAMEAPPQISFDGIAGFDRPRSYDAVPALASTALYVDDRATRPFGREGMAQIQAGLRLDILHTGGSWFSGVRDQALQPRLNVEVAPVPSLRFRGGWGRTAKLPSMGRLHPPPVYFDVVNVNWFADDPAERLALLTTFVRDPSNAALGLAMADKAEAGVEVGSGEWAVTLVGFMERVNGAFGTRPEPGWVPRDRFDLENDAPGTGEPPRIVEPPVRTDTIPVLVARPDNNVRLDTRGVEATAFLPEIRPLRTRVQVQAAWIETEQERGGPDFGGVSQFRDFQLSQGQARAPYWESPFRSGRRALATYRVVHHQPTLGLVITGTVQHNLLDRVWDRAATDTLAFAGYVTREGDMIPVAPDARGNPEFQDLRRPRTGAFTELRTTPADWIMGLQVRKSLPLNGHFSFWAFNLMDRRGYVLEPNVHPRPYPRTRFGLELVIAPATLLEAVRP
jgi:hypothetical protein